MIERKASIKSISRGIVLFIGVESNSYSSKHFFIDKKIIQTLFCIPYILFHERKDFSIKINGSSAYEDEKEIYRRKIAMFSKLIDNLDPTTPSFTKNIINYENTSDIMYQ